MRSHFCSWILAAAFFLLANLGKSQTFTNDMRVYSYSFMLTGLSGNGGRVYFSSPDNQGRTWPLGSRTDGRYIYAEKITGELAPDEIGSGRFRTDFFAVTSGNQYVATGDAYVSNVPVGLDANQDGFSDILQTDQAGSFTCQAQVSYWDYTLGSYQDRYPTLQFSRSKGSTAGSWTMRYAEGGGTVTLNGGFMVPGYTGKAVISKSPGVYSATLNINIVPAHRSTFSANVQFPGNGRISLSNVREVIKSNNTVLGSAVVDDLVLTQRIAGPFKGYVGRSHLRSVEPVRDFPSYVDSCVVVDCPDTDGDGLLDLTDDTPLGVAPAFTGAGRVVGEAGRALIPVAVGVSPVCRSFTATGLPPGLSINATSGVISGTPTTAGIYPFSVTARVSPGLAPATNTFTAWVGGAAQTLPLTDNYSQPVANRYLFSSTNGLPRMIVTNGALEYRSTNPPQNTAWMMPSLLLPLTNSWDVQVDARVPTTWPAGGGAAKVGVSLLKEIPGGTFSDMYPLRANMKFGVAAGGNFFEWNHHIGGVENLGQQAVTNAGVARLRLLFHGGTRTLTLFGASYSGTNLSPWIKIREESLAPTQGLGLAWGLTGTNRLRLALWGETDSEDGNANGVRRMALDNLSVSLVAPPRITGPTNFNGQVGVSFSNRLIGTNGQTYFTATNLPAGLVLDETNGIITGIPEAAGRFANARVGVGNPAAASDTPASFTILPAFTSSNAVTGYVNDAGFSHRVEVGSHNFGSNLKFSATGLPPGTGINATSGVVSGKPTLSGAFPATVTITAFGVTASRRIDFTLPAEQGARLNLVLSPRPISVGNLPTGLSYNAGTGVISGVAAMWGAFTASGRLSNNTTTNILISIFPSVPRITSPSNWVLQAGVEAKYQIVAGGPGREWAGYDDFTDAGLALWTKFRADAKGNVLVAGGRLVYNGVYSSEDSGLRWKRPVPGSARFSLFGLAHVPMTDEMTDPGLFHCKAGVALADFSKNSFYLLKGYHYPNPQNNAGKLIVDYSKNYSPGAAANTSRSQPLAAAALYDFSISHQPVSGLDSFCVSSSLDGREIFRTNFPTSLPSGGSMEAVVLMAGKPAWSSNLLWMDDFLLLPDPGDIEYRAYLVDANGLPLLNGRGQRYLPEGLECDPDSGTIEGILAESFPGGTHRMRVEAVYRPERLPSTTPPVLAGSATVQLRVIPAGRVVMEFVPVGNPGNPAFNGAGRGRVDFSYSMGKYKVTVGQYATFLNSAAKSESEIEPNLYTLYSLAMASNANAGGILRLGTNGSYRYQVLGSPERPAAFVSWQAAARFCNWMENGQGTNSILTGTYDFSTNPSGWPSGSISKNPYANFRLPNANEWFKAAYHDPTRPGSSKYWRYATRSDSLPGNSSFLGANQANFRAGGLYFLTRSTTLNPSQNYLTEVGAFRNSPSYYGTYDQNGNLDEWIDVLGAAGNDSRLRWGGAWTASTDERMKSSDFLPGSDNGIGSQGQSEHIGFRILCTTPP